MVFILSVPAATTDISEATGKAPMRSMARVASSLGRVHPETKWAVNSNCCSSAISAQHLTPSGEYPLNTISPVPPRKLTYVQAERFVRLDGVYGGNWREV